MLICFYRRDIVSFFLFLLTIIIFRAASVENVILNRILTATASGWKFDGILPVLRYGRQWRQL